MDRSRDSRRKAISIAAMSALGGAAATGVLMGGLALADQDDTPADGTVDNSTVVDDDLWSDQTSPWADDDGTDSGSGSDSGSGLGSGSGSQGSGSSGRTGGS